MILFRRQACDASSSERVATDLPVLILANGLHREPNPFLAGPLAEQHAVAEHALPEQHGRVIQHHDVEERARHGAPQPAGQPPDRLAALGPCRVLIQQDPDVEVAVGTTAPTRPAAEEKGQAHLGELAKDGGKPVGGRRTLTSSHPGDGTSRPARTQVELNL